MKNILKMFMISIVCLMVTGCVKIEFNMGIHKDKSMDFKIIQAFDKSLLEEDSSILDSNSFEDAEDQGFLVRDYEDDSMKGYVLTKKFDNIDNLSTEETDYVSDMNEFLEKADISLFSIKKGFFKNSYTAKLKVSTDDMSSQLGSSMESNEDDSYYYEDEDDGYYYEDSGMTGTGDFDYSQMMNGMEMNFIVSLPYKAIDNNATAVDNDGKKLTWNLLEIQDKTVDFEFEIYNMTNIYIVVGVALVVVVLVVTAIIKNNKKDNSSQIKPAQNNFVNQQSYYTNENTSINNNLNNSNSFINVSQESNVYEQPVLNNSNSFINASQESNAYEQPVLNNSNNLFFSQQSSNSESYVQNQGINNPTSVQDRSVPLSELNQVNSAPINNTPINNMPTNNSNTNNIDSNNQQNVSNPAIPTPIINVDSNQNDNKFF